MVEADRSGLTGLGLVVLDERYSGDEVVWWLLPEFAGTLEPAEPLARQRSTTPAPSCSAEPPLRTARAAESADGRWAVEYSCRGGLVWGKWVLAVEVLAAEPLARGWACDDDEMRVGCH